MSRPETHAPCGDLVGDGFTVTDVTAAAVKTALPRPLPFSYRLPAPWTPRLVELRASVADRAETAWVMDIDARHRGPSAAVRAGRSPGEACTEKTPTPREGRGRRQIIADGASFGMEVDERGPRR